jgi:hypothetical protein
MKELEFNPENGTILLEGVDILQNRNNAIIRSSGAYPWADNTLLITKNDHSFNNLLDYLRYKVPALTDYGNEVMLRNKPVEFMIDGLDHKYSLNEIRNIPMSEIEIIDIMYPGFRRGFSLNPSEYDEKAKIMTVGVVDERALIAIYKKATSDNMYSHAKGRLVPKIKGYTLSKKFYSPEYTLENINSPKPDFRPTLYWNPDLQFENGRANVNFYTSDELAQYVVFVEGITKNGKICYGTASFTVDKKQ